MRDILIVGSGPAGYTAAIYAARAGRQPLLVEGSLEMGGALMLTSVVENFPGFPDGIEGPELSMLMRAQAERFGTEFVSDEAERLELEGPVKRVHVGGEVLEARTVIVATGSRSRMLGLPSEDRLTGAGIHTCATCDGAYFQGGDVVVIGGGDSAMEEALFLTRFAERVTVLHRGERLRASQIMQERAFAHPKIEIEFGRRVEAYHGDAKLEAIDVAAAGSLEHRVVDGVFVAIGHVPRTELVRGQLDLDDHGYIKVVDGTTWTGVPGVYAAGDVVDARYRQAITASGMGCAAALDVERHLAVA